MYPLRSYDGIALAYYQAGFAKGFVADACPAPLSVSVPETEREAFNEGLEDGALWGEQGFPVEPACFGLVERDHNAAQIRVEVPDAVVEGIGVRHTVLAGALASAVLETALLRLMTSIALMGKVKDPETVLGASDYASFSETLAVVGEPVSVELFFGCGIDLDSEYCEMQMTPAYKSRQGARLALDAMGRPRGLITSIRTDMSGFNIVEHVGF